MSSSALWTYSTGRFLWLSTSSFKLGSIFIKYLQTSTCLLAAALCRAVLPSLSFTRQFARLSINNLTTSNFPKKQKLQIWTFRVRKNYLQWRLDAVTLPCPVQWQRPRMRLCPVVACKYSNGRFGRHSEGRCIQLHPSDLLGNLFLISGGIFPCHHTELQTIVRVRILVHLMTVILSLVLNVRIRTLRRSVTSSKINLSTCQCQVNEFYGDYFGQEYL